MLEDVTGRVVVVSGASGGLGTSTLACAVARRAHRGGVGAVLVDLVAGGGLDTTVGAEHRPGYRWPDLADADGELDGGRLLARLPEAGGVPVLGSRGPVPARAVPAVVATLRGRTGVLVADCGHLGQQGQVPTSLEPDLDVVLVGVRPRQLADGDALVTALADDREVRVVTRGRRVRDELSESVALALGVPLLGHLAHDPGVTDDEDRGRCPGGRAGGLSRAADAVLRAVLDGPAGDHRAAPPGSLR